MAPKKADEPPPPQEDADEVRLAKETKQKESTEKYTKYMMETGVAAELTRLLVGLYEAKERPTNAEEWARKFLSAPGGVDVEELTAESADLRTKNALLEETEARLTAELEEALARAAAAAEAEED